MRKTQKRPEKAKQAVQEPTYCLYVGPTIRGVVQQDTVLSGAKSDVLERLKYAVSAHPIIAQLVLESGTIADGRNKLKTPGNALYAAYRRLVSDVAKKEEKIL